MTYKLHTCRSTCVRMYFVGLRFYIIYTGVVVSLRKVIIKDLLFPKEHMMYISLTFSSRATVLLPFDVRLAVPGPRCGTMLLLSLSEEIA